MTHRKSSAPNRRMLTDLRPTAARVITAGAVALAALAGCDGAQDGKSGATPTTAPARAEVGVVDFDRAFKELGWVDEINATLKKTNAEYGEKIQAFEQELKAALQTTRSRIADAARLNKKQREEFDNIQDARDLAKLPLTPDQRKEYTDSIQNIRNGLQGFQAQAGQLSQIYRNQMVKMYTDSMQPALRRVAEGAGMTILATPAQIVYFHSTVDVTKKVIDELRSSPPSHTLPDPPRLEMPKIQVNTPEPTTAPTSKPAARTKPRSSPPSGTSP